MTTRQVAEAVFDSYRFVKRLTGAGMERGLAEVLAEEHMGPWIRNVATKTDLATLREELANFRNNAATKTDLATVREELANFRADTASKTDLEHALEVARLDLEKRIAELRGDLIKWMFGALMAQGALVVTIIKLFS